MRDDRRYQKNSSEHGLRAGAAAGTGFHANSTIAAAMITSVMTICAMWLAPTEAHFACGERLMPPAVTKQCDCSSLRDGVFPASFSIARGSTIAARIGAALEEPYLTIDADGVRVPQIVVPIGDHLNRLSSPLQLTRYLIRDAALE